MPTLNVQTNVPLDSVVTSDILKDASKAVARILGKPESYVMISLRGGVPMSFGGSEEPTAYGELISIGGIGPESNKQLSAALAEILQTKLSIPPSRFYIKFYDVKEYQEFRTLLSSEGPIFVLPMTFSTDAFRPEGSLSLPQVEDGEPCITVKTAV